MAIKLTDKQERFVLELLKGKSQREAYKSSYNAKNMKDTTIDSKASVLFANDKVRARYNELKNRLRQEAAEQGIVEARDIISEIASIAFDNIGNYLDFRGEFTEVEKNAQGNPIFGYKTIVDLKDSHTINTKNISEISQGRDGQFKFKLYSRDTALYKLAELLGAGEDSSISEGLTIQIVRKEKVLQVTNRLSIPPAVQKEVNPRFEPFLFDWNYRDYFLVGAYGSSKSYHIALKIILKCLEEKRKVLVVREVYETIRESCFDLFIEILNDMNFYEDTARKISRGKAQAPTSPMQIRFWNGSRIIFKGMDKPAKLKSINGVSIVWMEEASEIKYSGYKELLGRLRHPTQSLHFFLSTNPIAQENWVYKHFFKRVDEHGKQITILDDERLYKRKTIVKNGVYYHHSIPEDNLFLPVSYIKTLEELKAYDPDLYRVARWGRFGVAGLKVLPQFRVAVSHEAVMLAVKKLPAINHLNGMDFGFSESYNAVLKVAVDPDNQYLYIYKEYYKNQMTDDEIADELISHGWHKNLITADSAAPKDIAYYRKRGLKMRACKKSGQSRLANIKKVKRFKKIICSPECINTVRELQSLTYYRDKYTDEITYDEFNIDPHTFSAIWYALDRYNSVDIKERKSLSRKGGIIDV